MIVQDLFGQIYFDIHLFQMLYEINIELALSFGQLLFVCFLGGEEIVLPSITTSSQCQRKNKNNHRQTHKETAAMPMWRRSSNYPSWRRNSWSFVST